MQFRNILFVTSILMIGFCLTLYFQSGQQVHSLNWDQYKNLQYNEERSHSLTDLNRKLAPDDLLQVIHDAYEKNRLTGMKTRVMEIGVGNGRVLMELKKAFPEVEFYGINKEKTHTFYRRESFILTAMKFGIMTKAEMEDLDLPYIVFVDLDFGRRIPYDDNKFDVIFSQNTLSHIKYKFELLNEILRVLKPGGTSYHTDINGLLVYAKGLVLEPRDALAEFRRRGLDIMALETPGSIRFRKSPGAENFPVAPHQAIPEDTLNLSQELRRPEMGYNLK